MKCKGAGINNVRNDYLNQWAEDWEGTKFPHFRDQDLDTL